MNKKNPAQLSVGSQEAIDLAEQWGAHNYHPLEVVVANAEGVWVEDPEGNRYMDMLSAYSAVNQGHRHPRVIGALIEQAQRVTLTSRAFHNDRLGPFLKQLCALTGFEAALPMNTGAEAVETAIKAARKWGYKVKGVPDGQAEIIVATDNFHGRTTTIVGFSTEAQYRDGFGPFTPGFRIVPFGDADALAAAFNANTVAFLIEPIQGEAGINVPPDGYLARARALCDQHNALLIADEIQTGFGRTGRMFAHEWEGISVDGMCLGKALGGGVLPVSAFVADKRVMDVFHPGDHGSTFGGNPLGAAVAMAALDVLIDEDLTARAAALGDWFMAQLLEIDSPHVQEVRGRGLLIGVEIKESSGRAGPFCDRLKERGLLCKETHAQVIRFAPPLVITKDELAWALGHIREVLTAP
ncbi:MAG: ornithine--oxo-acid transaminase [Alphaproteobacteria bacterium]|nr:ornithine--oxo-acid transaminase [Alphaproteobacteria bacterium]